MDVGNIVLVQGKSGGVEYGKCIIPLVSSHLPFGEDLNLGTTTYHIEGNKGMGATVSDYRKGQSGRRGDFSPRLPHHRTCGSASGGSWQS